MYVDKKKKNETYWRGVGTVSERGRHFIYGDELWHLRYSEIQIQFLDSVRGSDVKII